MKGIFVILDGAGDLPHRLLGDKTPLEVAHLPNLDFFATRGELGYCYTVKPGYVPGSDEAIVSLFGNKLIDSTRGQLEAAGAGVKVTRGDLALRANFATIDSFKKGGLLDRRCGRTLTTAEADILSKAINKIKMPFKFEFKSTIQHRGALVFRGGFSDNIIGNDPHPYTGKFRLCKPLDDEDDSQYAANVLNEFMEKVFETLDKHPINEERRKKGLMPANFLVFRGPGIEIPKLKIYKNWVSPSYMPLEIGFSKLSHMKTVTFDYPKLKKLDVYENLHEGLSKAVKFAIKTIKKYHKTADYAYIHLKETDLPGHDNKPHEKKVMLEYIDKTLFKFLKKFAPPKKIQIVVTADHSTPCKMNDHSADPVPVLWYNDSIPREKKFCEREARKGTLGRMVAGELLTKVGFAK